MRTFMELLSFVNAEADKLHGAKSAFNANTTSPELAYPDERVSAETRAFALMCLHEWIRRTEPEASS